MSDTLDVSGGTTSVATEDLEIAVEQLGRLLDEVTVLAHRLSAIESPPRPSPAVQQAQLDIEFAARSLSDSAVSVAALKFSLETSARGYEYGERVIASLIHSASTDGAHLVGSLAPGLAFNAMLLAALLGSVSPLLRLLGGGGTTVAPPEGIPRAPSVVRENNGLLTNRGLPALVRQLTESIGPYAAGSLGLPRLPGSSGYRLGAKVVEGTGHSIGWFEGTPVRLAETIAQTVTAAPQGYADRLDRVPSSDAPGGPQVVIERYTVPGEPDRFSVYVGGTVTFSPESGTEPWDTTSNVANAAGDLSGSVASVEKAMAEAGIGADSPVQLTGYSQGGGVVACIGAYGDYNLQGIVSFGGPTGEIPLPHDVPTVLVEHSDDLVPALGGDQMNQAAVLVRREVFAGEEIPQDYAVPAHHLEYYLRTAKLMDGAGSPQLDDTLDTLDGFTKGATLESSTAYRYERVQD